MTLYALDPGTEQSALVVVCGATGAVAGRIYPNAELLAELRGGELAFGHLVIEEIASYGMPVGREVFETVFWAGRFAQAWDCPGQYTWSLLPRREVKLALCGSPRAKDANIRAALIDRWGGVQSIRKGGPLYGIRSHCWAALALAVAYQDKQKGAA
jgi:hypothetical protein